MVIKLLAYFSRIIYFSHINHFSSASCRDEYLLSVTNKTEGLEIALFSKDNDPTITDKIIYEFLMVPQYHLSPECGEQSFRCNNIVTYVAKETSRHIAMVPLLDALLVLDIDIHTMQFYSNVTLPIEKCSPTVVLAIFESFYTVCVDLSMGQLYLYEIRVDPVQLRNSHLTSALVELTLEGPLQLSNFVYANLGRQSSDQRIYFAISNSIYVLIPLSGSYSYIGSIGNCKSVYNLVYVGDWVLLSYCSDGSLVYFDLQDETVTLTENVATDGEPYYCPNSNVLDLRVYRETENFYVEFTFEKKQSKTSYKLPGNNYHSGVCFSAENSTYLAYIDSEEGVFVFDLVTYEFFQLSSNSCPTLGCLPLLIINSTYLVIQEEIAVVVIYREGNNFSQVISVPHLSTNAAKLLTVVAWQYECSDTGSNTSTSAPPIMKQNDIKIKVVVSTTVVVVVVAVIAFVSITATVVICFKKMQK